MVDNYRIKSTPNEIISGIARKYIITYFDKVSERKHLEIYYGPNDSWCVQIGPEKTKIGGIPGFTTTILTFSGDPDAVEDIKHLYRMEFLSAGG